MKRRKFLTLFVGIGGATAAFVSLRFLTTNYEKSIANIIKRELSFLNLDLAGVDKFVTEFSKDKNDMYRLTMRGYSFIRIKPAQSGKVNQLVNTYLLSTDFFVNKMDETKLVKYVGLYNPYLRPCAHPFSHTYYPDQST